MTPKLSNYIDLVEIRELDVEGTKDQEGFLEDEDKWIWIRKDTGAMFGPDRDWKSSHKDKYFRYLKKYDVVISAGANQGMYVRFFAKKFQMVYAFEPDPLNFHCMVINNQLDNVVKLNMAVGAQNGFCTVRRNGMDNTGSWTVEETPPTSPGAPSIGQGRIPMVALDSMNFEVVDLLQLDMEGYEENALLGAVKTIERCRPVISVENGHFERIVTLLGDLDYRAIDQSVADRIWVHKKHEN